MTDGLEPKWMIAKRINGHAEPLGPTIQLFDTDDAAVEEARKMAERYHNTKFAVFRLVAQRTYETVLKEEDVG